MGRWHRYNRRVAGERLGIIEGRRKKKEIKRNVRLLEDNYEEKDGVVEQVSIYIGNKALGKVERGSIYKTKKDKENRKSNQGSGEREEQPPVLHHLSDGEHEACGGDWETVACSVELPP